MFRLIYRKYGQGIRWKDDLLSGLTVAFAFVAGVDPLVGLYAAFFVGLITSAIGGRPGMINPLSPPCMTPVPGFRDLSAKSKFLAAIDSIMIKEKIENLCNLNHHLHFEQAVLKMKDIVPEFISNNSAFEKLDNLNLHK